MSLFFADILDYRIKAVLEIWLPHYNLAKLIFLNTIHMQWGRKDLYGIEGYADTEKFT